MPCAARDADDLAVFGQTVRALRLARGMSIDALAASSGIAAGELTRLELGEHDPMLQGARALADALGISAETLMLEVERREDTSALFGQRLRGAEGAGRLPGPAGPQDRHTPNSSRAP